MSEGGQAIEIQPILLGDVDEALFRTRPFAGTSRDSLSGVESAESVKVKAGAELVACSQKERYYWVLLEGEVALEKQEKDGAWLRVGVARAGEGFGEVPLLTRMSVSSHRVLAVRDSALIRFGEQEFWSLLACCPTVRVAVMADMAQRLQAYQVEALHKEKLVALGTLAAGLMHELHNPGAAAKRSASQLRENLLRLQQVSLRNSRKQKTPEQLACMTVLLEHAVGGCHAQAMGSLEQADAEEAMAEWLAAARVENAFSVGPALVEIGFKREDLACAREAFDAESFSDALNWLEALVSSLSLVCAIEESISRISELVMAVKMFAYDER